MLYYSSKWSKSLVNDFKKFESVSKKLQSGGANRLDLKKARILFDGLINDFGTKYALSHLRNDSKIVTNPEFENGIIKILDCREHDLNREEKEACSIFLKSNANATNSTILDNNGVNLGL